MDIPWFRYLTILHEYLWSRDSHRNVNFHAAEVPIHFPCRIIAHYLICFRQVPRCRIFSTAGRFPAVKWIFHLWIFHGNFTLLIAPMNFSWTYLGFAILRICKSICDRETPIVTWIFTLQRYQFIFHLASLRIVWYAFGRFPTVEFRRLQCRHRRGRGGRHLRGRPRRRRGPQQRRRRARGTWQRRAPPAGTATQASARTATTANNSDDSECWPRLRPLNGFTHKPVSFAVLMLVNSHSSQWTLNSTARFTAKGLNLGHKTASNESIFLNITPYYMHSM